MKQNEEGGEKQERNEWVLEHKGLEKAPLRNGIERNNIHETKRSEER